MNNNYYGFKELVDFFDSFFDDGFSKLDIQPMRYNKLISTSSFPPANVVLNRETKELYIEVALSGCTEDDISLSFDSDSLKLVVDVPAKADDGKRESDVYIQRGLKKITNVETAWFVDPRFYDRDSCEVKFSNGLLTIRIYPKEDVRPKKINVFGNLKRTPPNTITEKTSAEEKKEE